MRSVSKAQVAAVTGALLAIALGLHLIGAGPASSAVLVASSLIAGAPIAVQAYRAARARAFSIDLLVTIAVAGALIIGEFVESAVVSFLFIFGAYLEGRTLERTRRSLRELVDMAPQEAIVVRGGDHVTLSVSEIVEGDRVVARSGEKVAVDGDIASGQAWIDESTITGESVPASKSVGEAVYSGTVVDRGFIEVVATRVGDDTTFAQIIELVEEAQEAKTKAQRFLDRFAGVYTPTIIVLSVLVFVLTQDVRFALTFLVIACPGALVISVPVSMVAGLGNGARHGVLVKGGDALERLSKVDTLVFDKTGTLTSGAPRVTEVRAFDVSEDRMLTWAAQLEQASEHPLGSTIVADARERGLSLAAQPTDVEVVKGAGLRGRVDGHEVAVGSRRLLSTLGVEVQPGVESYAQGRERAGHTAVFVMADGRTAGVISIADQIRPEAAAAIAAWRRRGVASFHMLTGDNRHTAHRVAQELGIDHVEAELLPADKVRIVRELTDSGLRVGMVGDGVNDAPAIAAADVGIAMGAGSDVAIQTADVILMANRFDQLVHARSLATATVRVMKQNTVIAVATVVLLLAGVLMQRVFMATGMLVHELSVLVVILNALRLVRHGARDADDASTTALRPRAQLQERADA